MGQGKIYISHTSRDKALVEIFQKLLALGMKVNLEEVYYSHSNEELLEATHANDRVKQNIGDSELVIGLVTKAYMADRSCMLEIGMALAKDKLVYVLADNSVADEALNEWLPSNIAIKRLRKPEDIMLLFDELKKRGIARGNTQDFDINLRDFEEKLKQQRAIEEPNIKPKEVKEISKQQETSPLKPKKPVRLQRLFRFKGVLFVLLGLFVVVGIVGGALHKESKDSDAVQIFANRESGTALMSGEAVTFIIRNIEDKHTLKDVSYEIYDQTTNELLYEKPSVISSEKGSSLLTFEKEMIAESNIKMVVEVKCMDEKIYKNTFEFNIINQNDTDGEVIRVDSNKGVYSQIVTGKEIMFTASSSGSEGIESISYKVYDSKNTVIDEDKRYNTQETEKLYCTSVKTKGIGDIRIEVEVTSKKGTLHQEIFYYNLIDEEDTINIGCSLANGKTVVEGSQVEIIGLSTNKEQGLQRMSYKIFELDEGKLIDEGEFCAADQVLGSEGFAARIKLSGLGRLKVTVQIEAIGGKVEEENFYYNVSVNENGLEMNVAMEAVETWVYGGDMRFIATTNDEYIGIKHMKYKCYKGYNQLVKEFNINSQYPDTGSRPFTFELSKIPVGKVRIEWEITDIQGNMYRKIFYFKIAENKNGIEIVNDSTREVVCGSSFDLTVQSKHQVACLKSVVIKLLGNEKEIYREEVEEGAASITSPIILNEVGEWWIEVDVTDIQGQVYRERIQYKCIEST